jgi:hypothetical protein
MTWAKHKQQFARAIKVYGLTPEQAKKATPRCGKCLTALLSQQARAVKVRALKSFSGTRSSDEG